MPRKKPNTDKEKLREYRRKRDFAKTREPSGASARKRRATKRARTARSRGEPALSFVIQKHQATSLHFDFRIELDGVMKSWAVPKGLSLDPSVKRLAMEVEDHPIEYNEFEGTIPKGEYGAGTVMIWDRGTYVADEAEAGESDSEAIRRGYREGKIGFELKGERLRGSFALVRTQGGSKPKWLLIKHKDEHVRRGFDPVAAFDTSVTSGRTLEQIEDEAGPAGFSGDGIEPMLSTVTSKLPDGDEWVYEELRDGPRVLAYVTPGSHKLVPEAGTSAARLDDIAQVLGKFAERTGRRFVLDGVVAHAPRKGLTYFVSDILFDDGDVVLEETWRDRRRRIEALFARRRISGVRLAEIREQDGADVMEHALENGWAGIVAKRVDSTYHPGKSSKDWRLLEL
jgi:bifunctional non-homologous end joining protein LigD